MDVQRGLDGEIGLTAQQLGDLVSRLSEVDIVWFVPSKIDVAELESAVESPQESRLRFMNGRVVLDSVQRTLIVDGEEHVPKKMEFELLLFLASTPNSVLPSLEMVEAVWNDTINRSSTLRTHICRIRKYLGPELTDAIVASRGVGYMFRDPTLQDETTTDPTPLHLVKE